MTKKNNYPTKTTVNLIQKKRDKKKRNQYLAAIGVFAICLLLFTKFLVIDRLSAAFRAQSEAKDIENQVETLEKSNENYNEVLKKYQHYFIMDDNDTDCSKAMEILEKCLLDRATVAAFTSSNNVMNVQLTGVTLNGVSGIVNTLNSTYQGAQVFVSEASNEKTGVSTVYLTIVLGE